jgi:hypothetical protein
MLARLQPDEEVAEAEQLQPDEPTEEELVLVPTAPGHPEDYPQADDNPEPQSSFPFEQ